MNKDDGLIKGNLPTDIAEQAVVRQAKLLAKEIEPKHDLWPGIAERIQQLPQQDLVDSAYKNWMPMSMAASILIAIGALAFAGYTNYSTQQQLRTIAAIEQSVQFEAQPSTKSLIEKPYSVVRTNFLARIATEEQQMSPEVRRVLKKNLKIIDDATREIHKALIENPHDPFLTQALLLTHRKELQLLNQVTSQGLDTI